MAALNARAFGSTRYAKTGGYRRSRDKKRVIPGMNPRDKRKPAVIRVSLGAREAHITLGLYRHAPLVSIIFLLLRRVVGRGRGRGSSSFPFVPRYYCYDHCFHPLHLRDSVCLFSPCLLPSFYSLFTCVPLLPPRSLVAVGVCGTLLKNYTSKPL